MTWQAHIRRYFDDAAAAYPQAAEPVFVQLAHQLIVPLALAPGGRLLDLGTGTGAVLQVLGSPDGVGIDAAYNMLRQAQAPWGSRLLHADMHHLPLQNSSFDTVTAAFALNSSSPQQALAEAYRVLRPSGRLALMEWGAQDEASALVSDIFGEYIVDDAGAGPQLRAFRQAQIIQTPWDEVESLDDLVQLIADAGFTAVEAGSSEAEVVLPSLGAFLGYKLGWPSRSRELSAMPEDVRRLCLSDLEENLAPWCEPSGVFVWRPNVIQVYAARA